MSFLEQIIPILSKSTLELDLKIKRQHDGSVILNVKPIVGEVSANASDAEKQLKAAMSVPLKVSGSVEEIERDLSERIHNYQSARNGWDMQLMTINSKVDSANSEIEKQTAKPQTVSEVEESKETDEDDLGFTL